jgi:hypothetical protein
MKPAETTSNKIVYKWLSYCIAAIVVYYWLITFGLVFYSKPVSSVIPRQTFLYRTFCRQNWRLFAITKVYNRQMNFIIRDKQNPLKADTTDLVQYLLTEKREYAPFNNYEDALDRILYLEMNGVEVQMNEHKKKLKEQLPGNTAQFYLQQASLQVDSNTHHHQNIDNIVAYGRYMMQREKKDTAGKEYQFSIVHKYISPALPKEPSTPGSDEQILFISTYKPF